MYRLHCRRQSSTTHFFQLIEALVPTIMDVFIEDHTFGTSESSVHSDNVFTTSVLQPTVFPFNRLHLLVVMNSISPFQLETSSSDRSRVSSKSWLAVTTS